MSRMYNRSFKPPASAAHAVVRPPLPGHSLIPQEGQALLIKASEAAPHLRLAEVDAAINVVRDRWPELFGAQ